MMFLLCWCTFVDSDEFHKRRMHGAPTRDRFFRPCGLELHLIRQAMDTVEFSRKGPPNQLRLVKYLARTSNAP